ncbi:hypothetical protein QA584_28385 [Anaerocolumna sp. AGMB13025]|uniref:hypothetical protein n=1 Tax=Anaerocolumna sp. AGMB13025 TaxID=3039116 RepID=UPI00241C2F5B|nr:hypothetical protein [Anaerocolumna sp. AGMB13025]WFR57477.1 hypothetical protein QA584_28385 [Anaerocolumna sp. AGMB13025]
MELKKLRDTFREAADILDELIKLKGNKETAEIKKEMESLSGRFLIKMLEIESLQGV